MDVRVVIGAGLPRLRQERAMVQNRPEHQDVDDSRNQVIWPDPSPLSSWWEAVMHAGVRPRPASGSSPAGEVTA